MSTWKSVRGCKACHKPAFLPTNSSRSTYQSTDTMNNRTPPAYGGTDPIRYGSTWQLMVSGSNILVKTTSNISTTPSGKKLMTSLKTVLMTILWNQPEMKLWQWIHWLFHDQIHHETTHLLCPPCTWHTTALSLLVQSHHVRERQSNTYAYQSQSSPWQCR